MKLPRRPHKRFQRYAARGIRPNELESLILDRDPSPILQEDHVASYQHDREFVAPVSVNAHQRLERNRTAAGVSRKYEKNAIKRTIQWLKSSAVFDELHAEAKWRKAEDLENYLKRNDRKL